MPWTKVFIEKDETNILQSEGLRVLSFRNALKEAQAQILTKYPEAFLMGEGVDDVGGIFGTTLGLVDQFGKERVMDIPLAENGMTGIAIGAAAAGMKPIFIHQRSDFLPMCFDQIVNHAAKLHYMTGGQVHVPLVIRNIIGRGFGSAAQHSQGLHGIFLHIPGIKIIMPSTPYDVKGLLIAAIEDENPILFVEHRWIYDYMGFVPEEMYSIPIGQGIIRRNGKDITIVALSHMVYESMKAAILLEKEGIDVEVIDPRTVKPMDEELIFQSVSKTGRLIVADVACKTGGIGAEVICKMIERNINLFKVPPVRINFPDTPTPSSPVLEDAYYPTVSHLVRAVKSMV
ncbi:MAG: alpha-ketoacid dehydrogenase subunit beta [Desulfobacterales bacterium]|nr:alpha-ketoacid dehydrogenase subunit beta [Desulfobacterales bacterium]